jgi:integrase
LRLLPVVGAFGPFVAAFRNRVEIVLAHLNRQSPKSAAATRRRASRSTSQRFSLARGTGEGGTTTAHPLLGDELRALRASKREATSPFIFVSERGAPFSVAGFAKLVERAGVEAKLPFKAHPHMLRHACGYALANRGTDTRTLQAHLGHRSIQSTVRYAELAPGRFKKLWRCSHRKPLYGLR